MDLENIDVYISFLDLLATLLLLKQMNKMNTCVTDVLRSLPQYCLYLSQICSNKNCLELLWIALLFRFGCESIFKCWLCSCSCSCVRAFYLLTDLIYCSLIKFCLQTARLHSVNQIIGSIFKNHIRFFCVSCGGTIKIFVFNLDGDSNFLCRLRFFFFSAINSLCFFYLLSILHISHTAYSLWNIISKRSTIFFVSPWQWDCETGRLNVQWISWSHAEMCWLRTVFFFFHSFAKRLIYWLRMERNNWPRLRPSREKCFSIDLTSRIYHTNVLDSFTKLIAR